MAEIYIGTILLERNRHRNGKVPTYRVSEWVKRFRQDGFDGIELWENHALLSPPDELAVLKSSALPVSIFNSYAAFHSTDGTDRDRASLLVKQLGARGVKFNLGQHLFQHETCVRTAKAWFSSLPSDVRILCECHPGTTVEEPERAAAVFAQWGEGRVQAIVHPFAVSPEELRAWFHQLGPTITHAHVQMRGSDGKTCLRLDRAPERVREALSVMRAYGFQGSFTLEFTEGTNAEGETMEALYQNALADMAFLKENWS